MSEANKIQFGGDHYKTPYEHWDFTINCLEGRYLEGCITKYVARWRKKNGLQDLQKAMHYLDKLIELFTYKPRRLVAPLVAGAWRGPDESPAHFCDVNDVRTIERYIIIELSRWCLLEDLLAIKVKLQSLIDPVAAERAAQAHKVALPTGAASAEALVAEARRGEGEEPGAGYVGQ